jgi:glycosyltransferase involved in cell wall biosynthesis
MLGSILAWALRSPDLSAFIIAVIGRYPQLLDPSLHLEGVVFLRSQIDLLQNFSTQIFAKSDWVTVEMRPRPVGIKLKFFLTVATTDVSIIVPTWNEEKYLTKCLDSLVNQSWHGSFEIIVVDGGSTDRTVRVAEKYAHKVLLEAGQPVGSARNLGAKEAKGEILAFIDADTIASHYWLEEMATGIRSQSNVVGVTGPTLPYEGTQLDRLAYHVATGWVQRISFKLGLPHVAGFNCAYMKEAFWKAGGFDESRELSEDVVLGLRIRHQGRISFNPNMVAYTSIRRIKKYGYPYLTTYYMINVISMLFLGRTLAYPKVR